LFSKEHLDELVYFEKSYIITAPPPIYALLFENLQLNEFE
jgi:hypothetical protein